MAERLLRAGCSLVVCDPDPEAVAPLLTIGAVAAATPREAAAQAEVVLASLPTSEAFAAAVLDPEQGILAGLRPGTTLIDVGTTAPAQTRQIADQVEARGAAFIDAPVSGKPALARRGELAIMVGGDAEHVMACLRILKLLGRPVHCGPVGAGQIVRGIDQMVVGVGTALFLEAMAFGLRCQIDPQRIVEALEQTGAAQLSFIRVARQVADGTALERSVRLGDLPHVIAEAVERDIPLPLTEALVDFMASGEPRLREGRADTPSPWYELMTRGRDDFRVES
jgi:3-hydroxyisobutyrate dehydrogenase-like beta-hydroxyacid dehydrogenase